MHYYTLTNCQKEKFKKKISITVASTGIIHPGTNLNKKRPGLENDEKSMKKFDADTNRWK